MDWTAILAAAIAGLLSGFGTALLTARSTAVRSLSEAAGNLAAAFNEQLDDLRAEVAGLRRRVGALERKNQRLRLLVHSLLDGIKQLLQQVHDANLAPVWCPPTDGQIELILNGEERDDA